MRKTVCILILCLSVLCLACEDKKANKSSDTKIQLGAVATGSFDHTDSASNSTKLLRLNRDPLSVAHREYLSAYNTYVMLLRESGPQTMDTLEALANYQKKYQIYRMMMGERGHR